MGKSRWAGRQVGRAAISIGVVAGTTVALATPAWALYDQIIHRNGCNWGADSYPTGALTIRSSPNDCSGHGWVRIMLNGSSTWTAWTHSGDTIEGARQTAPSGRTVQKSQHKTCADCSPVTLYP